MKKIKSTTIKRIIISLVSIITIMLVSYFALSIKNSSDYFHSQANLTAGQLTTERAEDVCSDIDGNTNLVQNIATGMSGITGFEQIDVKGNGYVAEYAMPCLQFLNKGIPEYRYGEGAGSSSSDEFVALIAGKKTACSDIFTDASLGIQCIAVYSPIENNPEIDGVLAYFKAEDFIKSDFSGDKYLQMYCLARGNGSILDIYSAGNFATDTSHNIYTYLSNINVTKDYLNDIERKAESNISSTCTVDIENNTYIVSCVPVYKSSAQYILIDIYLQDDIIDMQYPLYNRLIGSCVALSIFMVIILLVYVFNRFRNISKINEIDEVDPLLGCNTYNKFLREASDVLAQNRHSSYSVVYLDINNFSFFRQNFGSEMCDSILKHMATIIKKMVSDNESYGHISDDHFAILMHCANSDEFTNRIKIITALIANYNKAKQNNVAISVSIGIYRNELDKNYSIQEMMDRAMIAQKIHKKKPDEPFIVYDSSIRSSYLKQAEIESKMEYALQNREFKVFFQPKYNIANDRIDGAEALVRWYDPEYNSYTNPDDFVPFFEVNGFISKLDRYVFDFVCNYLKESTERGEKTVPVSINVSRVTATKVDFLTYYINTKRQYGIPDGYLTLEFTESFAYENYDTIYTIVSELHKNGFHCSIDDFGSGYSSFEIIKALPMDELKLDKLFLKPSSNKEKDVILLKTIVSLGNSFAMKVTQEGVETRLQLEQFREYGCDVIQGYYYSKPLPMSDFIEFINTNTSMNHIVERNREKQLQNT